VPNGWNLSNNNKNNKDKNNNNKYKNKSIKAIIKIGMAGPKNKSKKSLIISYKPVNNLNLNNNTNKINIDKLLFKNKKISIKNKIKIKEFLRNIIIKKLNFLVYNTGIIEYYCFHKDWFINYKPINNKIIYIAFGEKYEVSGQRNIPIKIKDKKLLITNVFYVPPLREIFINGREL
jgi:hypothetical protein